MKEQTHRLRQYMAQAGKALISVFIELTNGDKHVYLGYYGDPKNPSRGQLRVDADLARNGYWDVKKTYKITKSGYDAAHDMIDKWGTKGGTWRPWCNCADFAEAIATVAGISLDDLPKSLGVINRPRLWGKYLRAHGGTTNIKRGSPIPATAAAKPEPSGDEVPGLSPAALSAMQRCNEIARTMIQRQNRLTAILRACPKPTKPGDDPPPCPAYERAAAENARINRESMTCNKDANGNYIPLVGSSTRPPDPPARGTVVIAPKDFTHVSVNGRWACDTTDEDSCTFGLRPGNYTIRLEYSGGRVESKAVQVVGGETIRIP